MSEIAQVLERVRLFNLRFIKRKQVEPRPEPPADGVVYLKRRKILTRNESFKRVIAKEVKSEPEKIKELLYPTRSTK